MKIKVYSLLVSLVFIPVAILGQFLGLYLGKIIYFIYVKVMSLNMPDILIDTAPPIISGVIAGYVSALIVANIVNIYTSAYWSAMP